MKNFFRSIAFVFCVCHAIAQDSVNADLTQIASMSSSLDAGGIEGFLDQTRRDSWRVPHIPSQWHVEHVSKPDEKPIAIAAREFGWSLVKRLAEKSTIMQQSPSGDSLYSETKSLLELSEWCGAVEGYGNALLAQRSLDLAAVGVARLTADLDFPMQTIDRLLERMDPEWIRSELHLRVLNKDAGAVLFISSDREEMQRVWGSGNIIRRMKGDPALSADLESKGVAKGLYRSQAIDENLSFFIDTEAWEIRPPTLLNKWDKKRHITFINGLSLQSIEKARALAEFRRKIGYFPEKPIFSEAELRDRERGIAEAAKSGLRVTNMEDMYTSPRAAAFAQAWKRYLQSEVNDIASLSPKRYNLDSAAFQAYNEVQSGTFLDQDSQQAIELEK